MSDDTKPLSPRGAARRKAILDAALALFARNGFERTSLRAVGERAGASTETIYRHFRDKDGLLQAVADMLGQDIARAGDDTSLFAPDAPPETVLARVGQRFLSVLLQPTALGFYRLAVSEAAKSDVAARAFWDGGPRRTRQRLADYLTRQTRDHVLTLDDPALAAEQFFGMLHSTLHMRVLLGLEEPDAAAIDRTVDHAVRLFLDGCRARP